jgi:transposase
VFVCLEPMDMRKGFEGLHAAVEGRLGEDVRSGALFVFTNRRRTRPKILYFDGTGLWLLIKRLERGTFFWPRAAEPGTSKFRLSAEAFSLLTDGGDMHRATGGTCIARRCGRGIRGKIEPSSSYHLHNGGSCG